MGRVKSVEWSSASRVRIRNQIRALAASLLSKHQANNPQAPRHPGDQGIGLLAREVFGVRRDKAQEKRDRDVVTAWVRKPNNTIPEGENLLRLARIAGSLDWLLDSDAPPDQAVNFNAALAAVRGKVIEGVWQHRDSAVKSFALDLEYDQTGHVHRQAALALEAALTLPRLVERMKELYVSVLEREAGAFHRRRSVQAASATGLAPRRDPTPPELEAHIRSVERQTGKRVQR